MRKLAIIVGLYLFLTGYLEAQTVKSVFNYRYPMIANLSKTFENNELSAKNINLYRNQFQKIKEGYKEIEMFEFNVVTSESYKLFDLKELKELAKDSKIDSLKKYMVQKQRELKFLLKDKTKYGADSTECLEQYSNLTRFVEKKDYKNAYKSWKILFEFYPISFKNIYIQGDILMRNFIQISHNNAVTANNQKNIEKTKTLLAEEQAWVDTLLIIYDQRIKYFGDDKSYGESYLTGKKGVYIFKYRRESHLDTAYQLLKYSVTTDENDSDPDIIQYFFFASNEMYLAQKNEGIQVVDDYNTSMSELDGNILTLQKLIENEPLNSKIEARKITLEQYQKISSNLTEKFSKGDYATCEFLVQAFEKQYEAKINNLDWLKSTSKMLISGNCTEEPFYEKLAVQLYKLESSANSAYGLGQYYLKKGDYYEAAKYYEEAYTNETDSGLKGKYYYDAAVIAKAMNQFAKARTLALTSAQFKKQKGDVYILIAKLYAASSASCGADAFENAQIYWLAVDKLLYAKSIDVSVSDEANSLIGQYSSRFPSKEEGFMRSIYEGNSITIGCWIQETTKARYIK